MIDRVEIDRMAEELSVRPTDVERDYVNGWLLAGIYGASDLGPALVLKGGNALRKGYFPNTRYSNDLDFTAPRGIDRERLGSEMLRVTKFVTEKTGVRFIDDRLAVVEPKRANDNIDLLEVRAYFLDFYGEKHTVPVRVYMDVTEFDRLYVEPVERALIHPYSDAESAAPAIRCVAVEEILASKLKCLLQRRKASDLFDYLRWLIFEDLSVDRQKVLSVFLKKTIYGRAPGAAFQLLAKLPFAVFQELWTRYLTVPSTCVLDFGKAVERFTQHLSELFGADARRLSHGLSFFPAELREPIMSAGRAKHLLQLRYDGFDRLVEPYALKYMIKKDGVGREYFFGFDRSGGSSGQRSMKTFVAERVEALTELSEVFEPRYEIEVSQAGDMPDDPHFHGRGPSSFVPGFGITRSPVRTGRAFPAGPKHRIKCPVCNKTFSRADYDLSLRPHKHPAGHDCYGSSGIYLGYR